MHTIWTPKLWRPNIIFQVLFCQLYFNKKYLTNFDIFRNVLKDKNAGRRDETMRQKDVEGKKEIVNKSVRLFKYIIDHANVRFSLLISLRTC